MSRLLLGSKFVQVFWLVGFTVALIFYYRWHVPLGFITKNLIPLPLALLHGCSLVGLGLPLTHFLLNRHPKRVQFLVALSIGMGLTGIFSLVLGLAGQMKTVYFVLWETAGLVLFLVALLRWRPFVVREFHWNVWNILGITIILLFLFTLVPFVVAPEISTDAIAYHLLIPKLYLLQGAIQHLPLFVEAYYPNLAELNYLPLLILSNEIVCKSFHFWMGVFVLLMMLELTSMTTGGSKNLLAPALFLSMPVTAIHMGWAWNDFTYTLFVLLSIYFLLCYHKSDKRNGRDLLFAGLMAGLSSWTKYTFVLYFFASVLLLMMGYLRWKWNVRHYLYFFAGIAFVAPFWMIQNWIFTENPFYPFLNQIFQSPYWSEHSDKYFHNALRRWEIADWNWTTYLTFPIQLMMKPRLVDIHTGIAALVLIPVLFLRSENKALSFLKAYIAAGLFVWLFIHTETRSMFTVFAVLFCVAAVGLERIPWKSSKLKHLFAIGLMAATVTSFFFTLLTTHSLFDPIDHFIGRETHDQYRTRLSESQKAFDYLNGAQNVGRIALISNHVPYYLNRPFLFSSFSDPPVAQVLSGGSKSSDDVEQKFKQMNISHILLNRAAYQKENAGKSLFVVQRRTVVI